MADRRRGTIRGHRRSVTVLTVVMLLASLMLIAVPVSALPSGSVDATVTVEGPCLTVPTTPVNFGPVGFSQASANTTKQALSFLLSNCGSQTIDLYAKASDATGDGGASWTLSGWDGSALMCDGAIDMYGAGVKEGVSSTLWLSTSDALYTKAVAALGTVTTYPNLLMPCTGSSGVGETMSFSYTFTGVLP